MSLSQAYLVKEVLKSDAIFEISVEVLNLFRRIYFPSKVHFYSSSLFWGPHMFLCTFFTPACAGGPPTQTAVAALLIASFSVVVGAASDSRWLECQVGDVFQSDPSNSRKEVTQVIDPCVILWTRDALQAFGELRAVLHRWLEMLQWEQER